MSNWFTAISEIYLNHDNTLKKEAIETFFNSLPTSHQPLEELFREWYGPKVTWQPLERGTFTGDSGDVVIKISTDTEVYFCKLFAYPENGLREYLAYFYILEQNIPQWNHVPLIKIGTLSKPDKQKLLYIVSKKANDLRAIDHLSTSVIPITESLITNLGKLLLSFHKEPHYSFSEKDVHARIHPTVKKLSTNSKLIQKLSDNSTLNTFHKDFLNMFNEFAKQPQIGHLTLGDLHLANFAFVTKTNQFETFDQSLLTYFLTPQGKSYHFKEETIVFVVMTLLNLQSINHGSYLKDLFLKSYYSNGLPTIDTLYETMDLWIRHFFLLIVGWGLDVSNKLMIQRVTDEILTYIKNPKAYLTRWLPYEK